jgi:hypothetical protein
MMMKNTIQKTTYSMLTPETKTPPTVIFSQKSLKWIKNLIKAHTGEVGFYGIVDTRDNYTFYVRDIFYPKQQLVTSATCEISPEGGTLVAEWLLSHDRTEDIGRMALWGHSHHSMGVEPSGQDNTQALELIKTTGSHLLRIIVNNEGFMALSFFDPVKGIRFDHVKWDEEKIDEEVFAAEKILRISEIMLETISPKEKIEKIKNLSSEDLEEKQIIEKIEELKKVNIPAAHTTTPGPHSYSNFHASEFHESGYEPYGTYPNSRINHVAQNNYRHKGSGKQLSFLNDFGFSSRKNKNKNNGKSSHPKTFIDDTHSEVARVLSEWDGTGGAP